MIRHIYRFKHSLLALAAVLMLPLVSAAQSGWEARYRISPAMTGNTQKVFVGQQNGTILKYRNDLTQLVPDGVLTAGKELPADLEATWFLSMPNPETHPDLIVGLATYKEGSTRRYGIIRSADFGNTWELLKPAVLASFQVRTGKDDFKRLPLATMVWLNDGEHGWLYGVNGIVATSDGGKTWQSVYQTTKADSVFGQVVFADEMNGVATMGDFHLAPLYKTIDGGKTWFYAFRPTFAYRLCDLIYADGQYRAIMMDPFRLANNTYMGFSSDGVKWTLKTNTFYYNIARGQTEMSELLWAGNNTGYMALRSGEIWQTIDGGLSWTMARQAEDTTSGSIYNVKTGSMMSDSAFGQTTIMLGTANNAYIVQTVTGKSTGELQYIKQWNTLFSAPASAPITGNSSEELELSAYPNPAASEVKITFHLPSRASVRLVIVDMLGQEIIQHHPEMMEAGDNTVQLAVGSLPSGNYRCIVKVKGIHVAAPLVIAR